MAQILLFNIRGDKLRKIRPLSLKLGLRCVEVTPEDFSKTLGALCGRADGAEAGVAESKLWCALYIFKELDLISGVTDRLEYRLIPDRRVQLDESALRTALQSVKVRGVNK